MYHVCCCLWPFEHLFKGSGWEISCLNAQVGTCCPIIPFLKSRDRGLWFCQEDARLWLRCWNQDCVSRKHEAHFVSLPPSWGTPCNRSPGQVLNMEMFSHVLVLGGSVSRFFIWPILWQRFILCLWQLSLQACLPVLATSMRILHN